MYMIMRLRSNDAQIDCCRVQNKKKEQMLLLGNKAHTV